MSYNEALETWGAKKLSENWPDSYSDISVDMDSRVEYGGYCETCSYETTVTFVRISGTGSKKANRFRSLELDMSLQDILEGVLETNK